MKVVVMGAGIMGVVTAYFLAKSGHQVIVLEKNSAAGLGCSYANGAQLSYSHIEPLASSTSLPLILSALIKPNSFLSINNFTNKDFVKWSYNFLKNCTKKKSTENSEKLFFLGNLSRNTLQEILTNEPEIKFNYSKKGILHFYRSKRLFENALKDTEIQLMKGNKVEVLSPEECVKKEPTISKICDNEKLIGGIFYGNDAAGDALTFLKNLEKICKEKYNVVFHYNAEIKNIFTNHKKITGIHTNIGVFSGDKYIYALGAYSDNLLKGIGVDSKIYPIKGYSFSIPVTNEYLAPSIGLTDPENKIVYSRVGNIFRAAGAIKICSLKEAKNENDREFNFIESKLKSTFSDFGNLNEAKKWSGYRPVRPNSIPLICEVKKYGNLYLNAGHGHLGWTMSFASGKIINDLVNGKKNSEFEFLKDELN